MRSLSNVNIYRTGYRMDEDDTVEIPDWSRPAPPPEEEQSTFRDLVPEDTGQGEETQATAAAIPASQDAPLFCSMTRDQVEKENQALLVRVRNETAEQAYMDARRSKTREIEKAIRDAEKRLAELEETHADYVARYTESLKYMAIEIAQKIMLQRIEEDDTALAALVKQTVSSMKHAEWINVEVSDRLRGLVSYLREELQQAGDADRISLEPAPCPPDTVRVSAEDGTIDASIHTQIDNLRRAFENAEKE